MKRILGITMVLLLLLGLCGCKYMPLPPSMTTPKLQEVQIGGVTYRTGFYEGLYTTLDCVSVTIHGKTDAGNDYSQLEGAPFDLIWTLEYGYYGHVPSIAGRISLTRLRNTMPPRTAFAIPSSVGTCTMRKIGRCIPLRIWILRNMMR